MSILQEKYYIECEDGFRLHGIINSNGKVIIPAKYKEIQIDHINHRYFAKDELKYYCFDKVGNMICELPFSNIVIEQFNNQTYITTIKEIEIETDLEWDSYTIEKVGLLDKDCNTIIPQEYNLIKVGVKYIALLGGEMVHEESEYDGHLNSSYIEEYFTISGSLWGIVDFQHRSVIPFEYTWIEFTGNDEYFLVNKNGQIFYLEVWQDGGYYYVKNGKWGIINSNNEIILPIEFNVFAKGEGQLLFQKSENDKFDTSLPFEVFDLH